MELNNLRPAEGSTKTRKRIGRGTGSGRGGTSTRGHKGDRSRSGSREKRAFEGGQTPMQRRLPKRGFQNVNRIEFVPLNIGHLESLSKRAGSTTLSHDILVSLGVAKATERIKILGKGKLTTKVEVTAHACSASARAAIEAAGGTIHTV